MNGEMPVLNVGKQIHNLSLRLILTLGRNNLKSILLDYSKIQRLCVSTLSIRFLLRKRFVSQSISKIKHKCYLTPYTCHPFVACISIISLLRNVFIPSAGKITTSI